MSYVQAVKTASEMDLKLVPYELAEGMPQTKQLIESARPGQQIAIFIGPEGGFDPEEIRLATEAGIQPITLGKRDPADGDGRIYDYRMADVSVGKLDSGRHGSPACGIF